MLNFDSIHTKELTVLYKTCSVTVQPHISVQRTAALHERKILPLNTNEMRYLRFRAIGALEVDGSNGNWDGFPYEDFEDERPGYGYRSFINKRAHLEHNSALALKGSIGDLPDAYLNSFIYPPTVKERRWSELLSKDKANVRRGILEAPGQRDGAIEVLMRIDTTLSKSSYTDREVRRGIERLTRMIDTGQKLTCSMGANVSYSHCSICGNQARFSEDYCDDLKPRKKGALYVVTANQIRDLLDKEILRPEWLKHIILSSHDVHEVLAGISNKGITARSQEINHGASFFELSIVGTPAFTRAKQLEKIARKADEGRSEYLKRLASDFSNDDMLDIYSMLQERGLISSQCEVS